MLISFQSVLDSGFAGKAMFHPKIARFPDGRLLMNVQEIYGSDFFGPVLSSESVDGGYHWSEPTAIPGLGVTDRADGIQERHSDTVPDFDPASQRMVAIGHNSFTKPDGFLDTLGYFNNSDLRRDLYRRGAYCVQRQDGSWSPRQLLNPEKFSSWTSFCCGCTQKIIRPDGQWLIPFGGLENPAKRKDGIITVIRFQFDGETFHEVENGNILELNIGRGLLEPSLIEFDGRVLMTLRSEDDRAHYAISEDGLHYGELGVWTFDDGTELITSTTQQHWLIARDKLHLVYTRRNSWNSGVFRYRAPLYIAEVNPTTMCLQRETERVVFPFDGDCRNAQSVALSGNFHVCMLPEREAMISDGSLKPYSNWEGLTMIARIR